MKRKSFSQENSAYREFAFPLFRRLVVDASRLARKKSTIYGLVEMDITDTLSKIRGYRVKSGSPLSLTAFLISCIGRAVEQNPQVHGYLRNPNKLVCFDDVDVCLPIEVRVAGHLFPSVHVLRAVNRRNSSDIEREIRRVRDEGTKNIDYQKKWRFLRWFLRLPSPLRGFFYKRMVKNPGRFKKHMGTVALTAVGMFGAGSGWGLGLLNHTLEIVSGGKSQKPVYVKGQLVRREFLSVTVCLDHDIVDGAPGARFTRDLKKMVESGSGLAEFEFTS